jgi:hypothetical protein
MSDQPNDTDRERDADSPQGPSDADTDPDPDPDPLDPEREEAEGYGIQDDPDRADGRETGGRADRTDTVSTDARRRRDDRNSTEPRTGTDHNPASDGRTTMEPPTGTDHNPASNVGPATGDGVGSDTLKWVSGVVSLIGLWIAVSPFVYGAGGAPLWNNLVVGGAIFLLAGYGFYRMQQGYRPDVGSTSLTALLGLWAVAAPFLLAYLSEGLVWSTVASGVAVAVLAGYNAYESRRTETPRRTGAGV